MDLCLGTVQFGMDYGIQGKKKPPLSDCLNMLDYAVHNGIRTIDTANAYGEAEDVVGAYLEKHPGMRRNLRIISKFRPNLLDGLPEEQYYPVMKANLEDSLRRLHTDYLDGYLLHSSRYVFVDSIVETLARLRNEGYVGKAGVSIYEVEEAKAGILQGNLDFLQVPYSVLDQRMLHEGVFSLAAGKGIPIHSRSAFIQGLVLMAPDKVPDFLRERAAPVLQKADQICWAAGVSRVQLAIGFVKRQTAISHLVFGVRNLEQLRENICVFQQDLPTGVMEELEKQFAAVDADIVIPSLWKK
ncbi:aldo/keto reductase [Oscillospiraceae bacterium 38-13]